MLYSLNISTAWNRYKTMLLQASEKRLQHSKYSYRNITRNQVPSLHNSMPIPILQTIYIQVVSALK